ncbi:MAG: hypothetical protein B6229_08500 [Spirochaetaceae bacterium 4572_7]|nr:MAG: hypothetical protein B6229_08500 [Spirochaetaceae bacterium 4572_7]
MDFDFINNVSESFQLMNISIMDAITRFIVAGILGTISSFIYKMYSKENYIHELQQSLIFLTLIISSSMMIIGNNLASAFGLVGAVSIIRFRTVVKSSRDMAFVLFNITIGMACGLGFLTLATVSFVLIGTAMMIIYFFSRKTNNKKQNQYLLDIKYNGILPDETLFEGILNKYECTFKLHSLASSPGKIRYNYYFTPKDKNDVTKIIYELSLLETYVDLKVKCTILGINND